jgi:glycosyltransferase involved in cell wall biosynthesis
MAQRLAIHSVASMCSERTLSVIVPIYNVEPYLRRCIESIQSQSYSKTEIILVDDGSPDGCGDICDRYALSDPRIRVVHQENAGLSAARNAGLAEASGEYCLFVDADDWCEPEMVASMISAARISGVDCAIVGYSIDYRDDGYGIVKVPESDRVFRGRSGISEAIFALDSMGMFNVVWNKLYRRDLLEQNDILFRHDAVPGEDLIFNAEYFRCIGSCAFVASVLYHYERRESETLVSTFHPELFEKTQRFNQARWALYEHYDMRSDRYLRAYANTYLDSMGACWTNLYRRGARLNWRDRLREINRLLNDTELLTHLGRAKPNAWSAKLFRCIFRTRSPWLVLLISQVLFGLRHSRAVPYRLIRRVLAR